MVETDLLGDEIVQEAIHPQDQGAILLRLDGQIVHFIGVGSRSKSCTSLFLKISSSVCGVLKSDGA